MESAHEHPSIIIPQRTLLVLCGSAGSGKSTFARWLVESNTAQGLRETMIVASDRCRALVCDDEHSQLVNRDAFDLFHYIIHKRMLQQRLTISDSTALTKEARQQQLKLAQRHHYHSCLLVLAVPMEQSIRQNCLRQRVVSREVIEFHTRQLQQTLLSIPHEGWDQYYVLHGPDPAVDLKVQTS
jgi:protein phosphatase